MANYELRFKRSVRKDLRSIPRADVKRILAMIEQLAENPRPSGCQRLSARERYRIRQGRYRILYGINDRQLVVVVVRWPIARRHIVELS